MIETVNTFATVLILTIEGIMLGRLPKPGPIPVPGEILNFGRSWSSVLAAIIGALIGGLGGMLLLVSHVPQNLEELIAAMFIAFPCGYLAGVIANALTNKSK
ncbi:MAG: hypothetical protein MUP70_06045 [Candidatus Aminicenantes bacterium]|nr:hypothetical protein [Candidatus Aminicenantes bacterium]